MMAHRHEQPPRQPRTTYPAPITPSNVIAKQDEDEDSLPRMFRQCLDALVFTSAMFITIVHYFNGNLDRQEPSPNKRLPLSPISRRAAYPPAPAPSEDIIMDIQRLRQWHQLQQREQPLPLLIENYSADHHHQQMNQTKQDRVLAWATATSPATTLDHEVTQASLLEPPEIREDWDDDEKYTFDEGWSEDISILNSNLPASSLMPPPYHPNSVASSTHSKQSYCGRQDRRLAKMEVQLSTLIQQGQAALAKKIKAHELNPHEIEQRRKQRQLTE
ncbi:hypothetical protein DM01DRAFT_1175135 [Hesseltinella vesiculosa]|uniref:Uncharacterized protein n=1 Tax=Hesseltinella vesiculosa TaxID=101127 RepID=A0A1X2G4U7_9FUNG|nr:hypothetical protein DM01DRAFT_1175135 [Hesseltinella vesiculosa]